MLTQQKLYYMEKKFTLLFIVFCLLGSYAFAQGIYLNNFDNRDWRGITTIGSDKTTNPNVGAIGDAWSLQDTDAEHGVSAISTSWFDPVGMADAWLILPKLHIADENSIVRWEARAFDPSFPDGYEVRISKTGAETEDFEDLVLTVSAENTNWTLRQVDLADYEGDSIHIAIRNNSNDQYLLAVDNIFVGVPLERDFRYLISSNHTNIPRLTAGVALVGERDIQFGIQNMGSQNINSFEITYQLNDNDPISEVVEGVQIASGEEYVFTSSSPIDLEIGDGQTIEIEMVSLNGEDVPQETSSLLTFNFNVWPPIPEFAATDGKGEFHSIHQDLADGKIVVIDFFASWCQPCEFSVPALNEFYEQYNSVDENPLTVYGITVEPTDNTDEIMNDLSELWGGTYSKFKYTSVINWQIYQHYNSNHQLGSGGIPFFVMICPNLDDIANSEIISSTVGFNPNLDPNIFETQFVPAYNDCVESLMSSNTEVVFATSSVNVYPNPSTEMVNIHFELDADKELLIEVFSADGKRLDVLSNGSFFQAGMHSLSWKTEQTGMYFVKFYDGKSQSVVNFSVVK